MLRSLPAVLAACLLAIGAGGCAPKGRDRPNAGATLLLDAAPGAVHAGIYSALARGFDDAEGVRLSVRGPASPRTAARRLAAERADFAILDIHEFAQVAERGADLVAIMALVQGPLAGPWTSKASPLFDPGRVPARVRGRRAPAPRYPELVIVTSRRALHERPELARALVAALQRGYATTLQDPESSAGDLLAAVPGLARDRVLAQLDVLGPLFQAGAPYVGRLDPAVLRAWAAWEQRVGITVRRPDVGALFEPAVAAAAARLSTER